jgi:hypothetical protein
VSWMGCWRLPFMSTGRVSHFPPNYYIQSINSFPLGQMHRKYAQTLVLTPTSSMQPAATLMEAQEKIILTLVGLHDSKWLSPYNYIILSDNCISSRSAKHLSFPRFITLLTILLVYSNGIMSCVSHQYFRLVFVTKYARELTKGLRTA